MTSLFSTQFNDAVAADIAREIRYGSGYCIFQSALAEDTLADLLASLPKEKLLINNNQIGFVKAYNNEYLSHTLAVSKPCYQVITAENIRLICRQYFRNPYKLCNQRIYQTQAPSHLPWHTDNNLQKGNTYQGKHTMDGLMFMYYLSDVEQLNPFQLIPYSHNWSQQDISQQFFTDDFIEKEHGNNVVSVSAPKGTLIICNTRIVHRAKPLSDLGFKRLTFLFQVDEISPEYPGHGENILINTSHITDPNPEILSYLGFGVNCQYPAFPDTSISTMRPSDILGLQKDMLTKGMKAMAISTARKVLPGKLINQIRMKYRR